MVRRALLVTYAAIAYVWFLADMVWAIAFLADVPALMVADRRTPTGVAVAVDLALLAAFAVHHSVMARSGAKRALTRVVPAAAERATYVLVADALFALLLWQWRPIDGELWNVPAQPWRGVLWAGYGLGWIVAIAATFMIDHFDFLGLRQAASRPGTYRAPAFQARWLYRWVRHPLMLGMLMLFWLTPTMSAGHALLAAASTGYIAIGVWFEERDLRRHLGEPYRAYARRTPAILPLPRRAAPIRHAAQRDGARP